MKMSPETVSERLKATPAGPGIYIMRNDAGEVLYIGKASKLRTRLRSYFSSHGTLSPKTHRLLKHLADFEYVVTDTETEALILENTLIKHHKPRYNARLKDDKTYPYIKIDLKEEFPQVYFTRRVKRDGARYFGPFASAGSVRTYMKLLNKLFPYRSCTKFITGTDSHPCLEYYIERCVAPCTGAVSKKEYQEVINQVVMFMEGKTEKILNQLKKDMLSASDNLEFERARMLRDQIRAIEKVSENQKVVFKNGGDQDVIAVATTKREACVEVFFIRHGKLTGRNHFLMEGTYDNSPSDIISQFIKQFYDTAPYIPTEILVQYKPTEEDLLIEKWLTNKLGRRVKLHRPERGVKHQLIKMVADNATQRLNQRTAKWISDHSNLQTAMEELAEALNLQHLPIRIECYDISNIHGSNPVGSMVVFEEAQPKTSYYRRFQIKSVEGIDDYSMMQEILRRRFERLSNKIQASRISTQFDESQNAINQSENSWSEIPDLVLIDGGKGHLSSALQVLLEMGLVNTVALASLAKEREELFVPHMSDPITLTRSSQGMFLIQRIRDEAHRFAINYHRKRRNKAALRSSLDSIPGIGPKRKRMLITRFGSIQGVASAPTIELTSLPGITLDLAKKLKENT